MSIFIDATNYMKDHVKKKRIECGYTQKQVSDYLKMTVQKFQKYENGTAKIPAITLFNLSILFKVDMNYFFYTRSDDLSLEENANIYVVDPEKICSTCSFSFLKDIRDDKVKTKVESMIRIMANDHGLILEDKYRKK